ncbi:MAG: cell division protein FtsX [Clostridiales bacterium]|nr:cell division protein FtsX [Clostridiales bacterium]
MKTGYAAKIAFNNIRKNYRFYIPHVLTGTGLQACFYIMLTLSMDKRLSQVKGGSVLPFFMTVGAAVMALLSVMLIFYTNSFLMKQRKREFGLYNVLGMEKRHIGRILFFETLYSAAASIILGLLLGVLFYKLCSLFICRLFQTDIVLGFYFIKANTLIPAAMSFIVLYFLTYIFNRISISRMKPVELLKSGASGEKEPRTKWIMLIAGIISLGAGYYQSLSIKDPLSALTWFFIAVFLVIIGTYFLFTAGSIFVLKALKKNSRFYYHAERMTAVSGLIYRMKQNAVGLASIAILATGVLIMISSTVSLYSGMQGTLDNTYAQHMYITADYVDENGETVLIPAEDMEGMIRNVSDKYSCKVLAVEEQEYFDAVYVMNGCDFELVSDQSASTDLSGLCDIYFITADMYEDLTGTRIALEDNEIAICRISSSIGHTKTPDKAVTIGGRGFIVKEHLVYFPISAGMGNVVTCYGAVLPNNEIMDAVFADQQIAYGKDASHYYHRTAVTFEDIETVSKNGDDIQESLYRNIADYALEHNARNGECSTRVDSVWEAKENILGMYGALLFLGILLGLVCIFATVLIIYYKQISEGYEDRERFQIMKKIGMSDAETRKTIRTQSLFIFFLPLIVAGIHTLFAFPILNRMMQLMMLSSTGLYIICSVITYIVFAIIYLLIYRATSKTYYKIVRL